METPQTRRLCSEIQLFDLCELDSCSHKDGRFCTEPRILERFEAIKEEDERAPQYVAEGYDEEEGGDDDAIDDDAFDADEYDEEEL